MHIALVLNGTIEEGFLSEFQKRESIDYWIAVDGGIRYYTKNFSPDLFMGDMDSCGVIRKDILTGQEETWKERFHLSEDKIIKFPCEKDETDSELAVKKAISLGADKITILGWNGSRMDHVYGNITLLCYGLKHQIPIVLEDKNNRVFMVEEEVLIFKDNFPYLSLFSYSEEVKKLTLRGFKYEVTDFTLKREMVRGVSNEIKEEKACISFENGQLLVIQSKEE